MSKFVDEKDGEYIITLADPDACSHMMNEVCCNEKSPALDNWDYGFCKICPWFEREEMTE